MSTPFPSIFTPIRIGSMQLRNRIMLPPHATAVGGLFGESEREAERNLGYWEARARAGAAWIDGITGFIENLVPPGFEPIGVGARTKGIFRLPRFLERMGRYAQVVHDAGAVATTQLVIQGGMPHGASPTLSGPTINLVPHALTKREIRWFVNEYGYSARRAQEAGLDGVEVHANHDDMIEWFLSPKTNQRDDEYGGSREGRARYLVEILREIRERVGAQFTVGIRMNLLEGEPGGYDLDGARWLALHLQDLGLVDYVHLVMGSPWGDPSYIQPHYYAPAQWAALAKQVRAGLTLPVVYTGKVNSPAIAEAVIAGGMADVVGMARAHIADPEIVSKARRGASAEIRPCIGCNECIARGYMEALPFACTVNPAVGYEREGAPARAATKKKVLIVGGGPAGMQLAVTARERGHDVEIWDRSTQLGGQMRMSARLPTQDSFLGYLSHQERVLRELGVRVRLQQHATAESVIAAGADVVAIATGARARRPAIEGVDGARVFDLWQLLGAEADEGAVVRVDASAGAGASAVAGADRNAGADERAMRVGAARVRVGGSELGERIAIVAQDDHVPPLAAADWLAARGHRVTLIHATNAPAPLMSRYTLGAILARLSRAGVEIVCMEDVVRIELPRVVTRHSYSQLERTRDGFDAVVLACGGEPDDRLYRELEGRVPELHVLGDAFAPRRNVNATRQGWALGRVI